MNTLAMTDTKAKQMSHLEDLSLGVITNALEGYVDADDDKVKVAVKKMVVVAKTIMHRAAVEFGMAQFIADEAGMKKYITATSPQIQKAISGKGA